MTTLDRSTRRSIAVTGSGLVVLIGVFAPWMRSGSSYRSSFELFDLVDRLGFAPGGAFDWAVRAWPLVPLITVGAIVGVWSGHERGSTVLAGLAAIYVGAVAVGVRQAPNAGLISISWGASIALVGAVLLMASAIWMFVDLRRSRARARRTPA